MQRLSDEVPVLRYENHSNDFIIINKCNYERSDTKAASLS